MRPPMISLTRLVLRRARQERLPQLAGSLAFTTVLSIVPLTAVCFALFTRFPVFARFEHAIEEVMLKSLLPAGLSRTVLGNLRHFADNANGLTLVGTLFTLAAAVALLLTVENALNQLWGIRTPRPFVRRIGLYLLMLALGPPLLGASLWATSTLVSASLGWIGRLPPTLDFVLTLGPILLGAAGFAALFTFVPNARVATHHALIGGLIAALAFEAGKRGFGAYVLTLPTYKAIYGALAALPVFLLWVWFSWFVTLVAGLITASLGRGGSSSGSGSKR